MEHLLKKLRDYSRFLQLENDIPHGEGQIPAMETRLGELERNLRQKEGELDSLESTGIFRSVLAGGKKQRERLSRQIQEITAARTAAQWELEALTRQLREDRRELEALSGSREAYEAAKQQTALTPAQESRLMMEEITAFVPPAREAAGRLLEALENLRFWIDREDFGEVLHKTEQSACRLAQILSVLPEGIAPMGSYLRAPRGFLSEEALETGRLEQAMEQIRTVENQLRLLLGE